METNKKTKLTCHRCGGQGYIKAFAHIADGVCFACGGSGEFKHTASRTGKKGYFEVVNAHARWEFRTLLNHCGHQCQPGEKAGDVILQAITGAGRTGQTLFRIRLVGDSEVEVARRIYQAALDNTHPDQITNEWLGFVPGRCAVSRNKKGVSFL